MTIIITIITIIIIIDTVFQIEEIRGIIIVGIITEEVIIDINDINITITDMVEEGVDKVIDIN